MIQVCIRLETVIGGSSALNINPTSYKCWGQRCVFNDEGQVMRVQLLNTSLILCLNQLKAKIDFCITVDLQGNSNNYFLLTNTNILCVYL